MSDLLADVDRLTREVARLGAQESIRACVYSYARALDRLDRALLLEQFWPDAEIDYGVFYKGPVAGFADVALGFQGSMRDTHHLVGNVLATIEGHIASAESYVQAQHILQTDEGLVQLIVGARYLDRFASRDGQWRIAFRTEVLDWGRCVPIPERWFEVNRDMPKGVRGTADPSYRYLLPP